MDERLVLVCPRCGAPLPPGAAHETVTCAFCGIASSLAALTQQAARSDLACPRCGEKLFSGAAHDVAMLGCGLCGGIWLDNASAQRVMQHVDEAVVELAGRAAANAVKRPDVREIVKCPACSNAMERKRVTTSNIAIDLCHAHGTWFDAGELAAVIAAVQAPATYAASAPVTSDWGSTAGNVASDVAVDVAGDIAVGAFELLLGILTD
jgi:Zn-finger nucleic acid-binding protein